MGKTVAVAVLYLVCASSLFSQIDQGQISGIVKDGSGAHIAGAQVTVVSQATKADRVTMTGSDGLPYLQLALRCSF